jgi:hypothetical protein
LKVKIGLPYARAPHHNVVLGVWLHILAFWTLTTGMDKKLVINSGHYISRESTIDLIDRRMGRLQK